MKIVFLSYLHGYGGAEKQIVSLANAMAERNHDVTLISICCDNNCYELDDRIQYYFLPDRKTSFMRIITRYYDIEKILKKLNPEITVNFWFQSAYMIAMMKKSITGKTIYSERGDPSDKEYNGLLGFMRTMTLPRINGFVFQSKGAQRYFDKKVQNRSVVISNPVFINSSDYPEVRERRKAIVTVGRLHPQKNQKLLIDAFSLIADDIPDYTLEIYGDGELKENLQKQIDELKMTKKIFLMGTSPKIHRLIYDASLFVLTSDYEGLPNTLLEAMALGIPCISTDCRPGGVREIMNDENGVIVPVGNARILADTMKRFLFDSELADMIGRKARISSKKYSSEIIYSIWDDFFEKIREEQ